MKPFPLSGSRNHSRGFSLMELMVSTAVLSLLLVMVFQMLNGMQLSWKRTKQVVGEFKEARQAFEDITRRVGQATLNAYMSYRYDTATVQGVQLRVGREIIPQSELHFVCGPVANLGINQKNSRQVGQRYTHAVFFQAPFGFCIDPDSQRQTTLRFGRFNNSMNAWGYYIEFNTDELDRPRLLTDLANAPSPRPRYRLMEFRQPTEYFQAYKLNLRDMASNSSRTQLYRWFTEGLYSVNSEWNTQVQPSGTQGFFRTTRVVADNIIAMILRPRAADQIVGVAGANAPPHCPRLSLRYPALPVGRRRPRSAVPPHSPAHPRYHLRSRRREFLHPVRGPRKDPQRRRRPDPRQRKLLPRKSAVQQGPPEPRTGPAAPQTRLPRLHHLGPAPRIPLAGKQPELSDPPSPRSS